MIGGHGRFKHSYYCHKCKRKHSYPARIYVNHFGNYGNSTR